MNRGRIVIVEDETPIRVGIRDVLRSAGHETVEAADGDAGLAAARQQGVALVLLDLMLPRRDGMDVLARLRRTHPALPVIILTARGGEDDRVAGLKAGADDYVIKPFSARELLARVEAVLRRSPERPAEVDGLTLGSARVDLRRHEIVTGDGGRHALSETECAILTHLAAHADRAVSRNELLARVWGVSGGVETRTVDMHVARLRAKLSKIDGASAERYLVTVRGKGYMLGPGARVDGRGRPGTGDGGGA